MNIIIDGIKDMFAHMARKRDFNSRISRDKKSIESSSALIEDCASKIDSGANYDEIVGQFKKSITNSDLSIVMDRYSDLMGEEKYGELTLPHSVQIKSLLHSMASMVPQDKVMDLAGIISRSVPLVKASEIKDDSSNLLSQSILYMSEKASSEDKVNLFRELDMFGLLNDSFKNGKQSHVALFLVETFKNMEDEEIANELYDCNCWNDIPRDETMENILRNHIEDGERFIHLLKIGNDVGSVPTPDME